MRELQATYRLEFDREQEIYFTEESTQPFYHETANISIYHTNPDEFPELLEMYSEVQAESSPWACCLNMLDNKLHLRIMRGQDYADFTADVPQDLLYALYESFSLYHMLFVNVFTETSEEQTLLLRTRIPLELIFYAEKETTATEVRWWLSRN